MISISMLKILSTTQINAAIMTEATKTSTELLTSCF